VLTYYTMYAFNWQTFNANGVMQRVLWNIQISVFLYHPNVISCGRLLIDKFVRYHRTKHTKGEMTSPHFNDDKSCLLIRWSA